MADRQVRGRRVARCPVHPEHDCGRDEQRDREDRHEPVATRRGECVDPPGKDRVVDVSGQADLSLGTDGRRSVAKLPASGARFVVAWREPAIPWGSDARAERSRDLMLA